MKILSSPKVTDLYTLRARLYEGLAILTIIVLTPFTLSHYLQDEFWLGNSSAAIVILFSLELTSQHLRKNPLLHPVLPVLLIFTALSYSVTEIGVMGIFWGFPALILLYLLLDRRLANIFSLLFILSLGTLVWLTIGLAESIRATVTLSAVALFANFFLALSHRLHAQLQNLSVTDPLTGAFNRRQLDHSLAECLSRRDRYHAKSSLISIDVDDFKYINDRFGHVSGDDVLKNIVQVIRTRTRRLDQIIRTGGDEFLVVLPETGSQNAQIIAKQLEKLVSSNKFLARFYAGISTGVSEINQQDTSKTWLERCDNALYESKSRKEYRPKVAISAKG